MSSTARLTALLVPLLLCTALGAPAQHEHVHRGATPQQLGTVEFPVSCAPEAAARFQRGVALLHSFWFAEAGKAFRHALEADARCAMAEWGLAMASQGNPYAGLPSSSAAADGLAAAERGLALGPPTERERAYLEAAAALYRDHEAVDGRQRAIRHEEAMERLSARFPEDAEAAVFHARALIGNAPPTDRSHARQLRAGAILQPLFERFPDHPGLAHYLIHAYDAPALAERGVQAARAYSEIAPSVPHAQHMPSHIFTRLGMWEASIDANRASARAAAAYEEETSAAEFSGDRLHAYDYLVYAYLQLGRDEEAREIATRISGRPVGTGTGAAFAVAAIPARLALERDDWATAAALPVVSAPGFRAAEGVRRFARGLGAARNGDRAAAAAEVTALAALRDDFRAAGDGYWAEVTEAQRLAVLGWTTHGEGDAEGALRLLAAAAEREEAAEKHPVTPGPLLPARELLGDLLMELGRPGDAREAYRATLEREPGRRRAEHALERAERRAPGS
jgi:hypothetical protein